MSQTPELVIQDLHVAVEGKEILKGVTLAVPKGEIHALMVPLLEAQCAVLVVGSALPLARKEIPRAVLARRGELTASGLVTRPESLSVVRLGNAVATLEEEGEQLA